MFVLHFEGSKFGSHAHKKRTIAQFGLFCAFPKYGRRNLPKKIAQNPQAYCNTSLIVNTNNVQVQA